MSTYILVFYTQDGEPITGLTPTIRIRDLSDNSLVITDAAMSEVGDGFYKYDFTGYDSSTDYSIRCDGGTSLSEVDRYVYGGNEILSTSSSTVGGAGWGFTGDQIVLLRRLTDAIEDVVGKQVKGLGDELHESLTRIDKRFDLNDKGNIQNQKQYKKEFNDLKKLLDSSSRDLSSFKKDIKTSKSKDISKVEDKYKELILKYKDLDNMIKSNNKEVNTQFNLNQKVLNQISNSNKVLKKDISTLFDYVDNINKHIKDTTSFLNDNIDTLKHNVLTDMNDIKININDNLVEYKGINDNNKLDINNNLNSFDSKLIEFKTKLDEYNKLFDDIKEVKDILGTEIKNNSISFNKNLTTLSDDMKVFAERLKALNYKKDIDEKHKLIEEMINLNNRKVDRVEDNIDLSKIEMLNKLIGLNKDFEEKVEKLGEHISIINSNIIRFRAGLTDVENRLKGDITTLNSSVDDLKKKTKKKNVEDNMKYQLEYINKSEDKDDN